MEGTEIYVADNASTDASCEVVEKEFPSVHLIRLDKNYGFADGYNYALQKIDAEYAVLLNSDVEVTEGWLQPMVDYLDTHPETVACQPKIRAYRHRNLFEYAGASGGFIDRYGYPFCRGRVFESVEEDKGQHDEVIPVFWATGAALMIRLDVYRNVGGLDGRFFAHMEEIDLCWRLRSRGYQLVCIPSSTVYHVGGATLKKENPRKTFLNFRNNLLMLYKNLPEEELKPVMRVRTFLDYCAAAVWVLKGDFANAKAVWSARREFFRIRSQFTADRQQNLVHTVLKTIPERYAACVHTAIPCYAEEGSVWKTLCEETDGMRLVPDEPCYCAVTFLDGEYKEHDVEIEAWKTVKGSYPDTAHVKFRTLPAVTVASCTFRGPYERIGEVYAAIAAWIADNGYECDGPMFNLYHVSPHETQNPEEFVTEACYPVRKQ